MLNLQNYFSQLSQRDRALLLFASLLIGFVFFKVFVLDTLNKQQTNLLKQSSYLQKQATTLADLKGSSSTQGSQFLSSEQVINDFLKKTQNAGKLKQIRTTSKGEKRFEIEDIRFDQLVELLNQLENNGSAYSSLQIKNRKTVGLVNVVMTLPE